MLLVVIVLLILGIDHVDALINSSSIKSDQGVKQADQDNAGYMNSDQGNQEDYLTLTSSIRSDQGNQNGTLSDMKSDHPNQEDSSGIINNQNDHSSNMKFGLEVNQSDQGNVLTHSGSMKSEGNIISLGGGSYITHD